MKLLKMFTCMIGLALCTAIFATTTYAAALMPGSMIPMETTLSLPVTVGSSVILHDDAADDAIIIKSVVQDVDIQILSATSNGWFKVFTDGKLGYIKPEYLSNSDVKPFMWPVVGYRHVTSAYGYRNISVSKGFHDGIDLRAPVGTEILAAASGTIIRSGYSGAAGNRVTIKHEDGHETMYAHLSKINVSVGDTVSQGEIIGLAGATGNVSGPHLHFTITNEDGTRLDPAPLIGV